MDSLQTKDLLAAIIIFFLMWTVGGFLIGFFGVVIGFPPIAISIASVILSFVVPAVFLLKRSGKI
jgi:hypothetical protein